MHRRLFYLFAFSVAALSLTWASSRSSAFNTVHFRQVFEPERGFMPSIAHGGGEVLGVSLSDSLDALSANSSKYELLEVDLLWTSDGHLVCLHDWGESFTSRFGFDTANPLTLAEFERLLMDGGLQNCTLSSLATWMRANPGKRVVTDIKEDNIRGLALVAESFPDLRDRFLPQAYQPEEIAAIKSLGFRDVIWTLYRFDGTVEVVLGHLAGSDLFAVTMPKERALKGEAWRIREVASVPIYVHTVNSAFEAGCFTHLGISGIYTDTLGGAFPDQRPGKMCKWLFR
jgi:hypothetical protein